MFNNFIADVGGPAALLIGKSFKIGSNSSNVIGIINLSIVFLTDMLARTVKFNPGFWHRK